MIDQVLLLVCCLLLVVVLVKGRSKKTVLEPPDFSGRYPIIGHSLKFFGDRKHVFNIVKAMSKESLEKGGVISGNIGPYNAYLISDPDDCAKVANECLEKDYYYSFGKPFLGDGLLTISNVPLWKQHRKLMSPAFRLANLNGLLVVFNRQAKQLVNQFASELDHDSFNLEKYVRLNSLKSICMTSFGADVAELDGFHQQYLEAADKVLDIFTERFQKFWLHSSIVYNWSSLKKEEDYCVKNIKKFTHAVLAKRKTEMNEMKESVINSDQFKPIMSYLLDISKNTEYYSEEDVLYETNTMVAAGYDTTTITITIVLMLVGSYPEVQKNIYKELTEVFGNSDRDVDKDDLLKLPYLEAVVKESLRLYPVAPLIARHVSKDVQLKNYTLKAGYGVALLVWGMHRHPIWGPDAEEFRPERWLDGSLPTNPNAFGGFSIGKRACIGKTYALMSIKTVISHILRRYRIASDVSQLVFEIHGAIRVASGQNISVEERNLC